MYPLLLSSYLIVDPHSVSFNNDDFDFVAAGPHL
jgi:hypothetical protein